MNRRQYLVAIGALGVGTAGCLGGDSGPDLKDAGRDAWRSRETEQTSRGDAVRGEIALETGQYTTAAFGATGPTQLGWRVSEVSGGPLDVFTIRGESLPDYSEGNDFRFFKGLSATDIGGRTERSGAVDLTGEVFVVFDNPASETEPADTVEFATVVGSGL